MLWTIPVMNGSKEGLNVFELECTVLLKSRTGESAEGTSLRNPIPPTPFRLCRP